MIIAKNENIIKIVIAITILIITKTIIIMMRRANAIIMAYYCNADSLEELC